MRNLIAPEPKFRWCFTATVINAEDFDSEGLFEFGDAVCIMFDIGCLSPGDLILDVDHEGSFIRKLRSLDAVKGPDRGKLLCELDAAILVSDPDRQFTCLGRVVFRIRRPQMQ